VFVTGRSRQGGGARKENVLELVYTVSPSVLCVQTLGGGRLALGAVPVRFLS
jgi:hypothetical protein